MNKEQEKEGAEDLLEKVLKTRTMPSEEEWKIIYQCAGSRDERGGQADYGTVLSGWWASDAGNPV